MITEFRQTVGRHVRTQHSTVLFPLTLTLSLGERGQRSPLPKDSNAATATTAFWPCVESGIRKPECFEFLQNPATTPPPHEPRSSRRKEAHSESGDRSQSLLTSAATVQGFQARTCSGKSPPKGEGWGEGKQPVPFPSPSTLAIASRKQALMTLASRTLGSGLAQSVEPVPYQGRYGDEKRSLVGAILAGRHRRPRHRFTRDCRRFSLPMNLVAADVRRLILNRATEVRASLRRRLRFRGSKREPARGNLSLRERENRRQSFSAKFAPTDVGGYDFSSTFLVNSGTHDKFGQRFLVDNHPLDGGLSTFNPT